LNLLIIYVFEHVIMNEIELEGNFNPTKLSLTNIYVFAITPAHLPIYNIYNSQKSINFEILEYVMSSPYNRYFSVYSKIECNELSM
jgi:hypothetical protein